MLQTELIKKLVEMLRNGPNFDTSGSPQAAYYKWEDAAIQIVFELMPEAEQIDSQLADEAETAMQAWAQKAYEPETEGNDESP